MDFIKNNKMFIFLFLSYLIIILNLSFLWIAGEKDVFIDWQNQTYYTESMISAYNGIFNTERKSVDLNWDLKLAKTSVERFEIFHEDRIVRDGVNESSAVLPIEECNLPTGNNRFDIKVYLKDETILEKTIYVYIDEVLDFEVVEGVSGSKILYTVKYTYDDRNPVSPPSIHIYESDYPLSVTYINAKKDSKKGHYVTMIAEYTLDYKNIEEGRYEIQINWEFVQYNLKYPKTSIIHVS